MRMSVVSFRQNRKRRVKLGRDVQPTLIYHRFSRHLLSGLRIRLTKGTPSGCFPVSAQRIFIFHINLR